MLSRARDGADPPAATLGSPGAPSLRTPLPWRRLAAIARPARALLAGMLALSGYADLVIAPRIAAIRDHTPVAMAALPATDPVRMEFGRLHGLSNGLLALALAGAVSMLWLDRRE